MRDYLSHEVRNVAVMGHSGSGKTAVLEAMLYFTKASDRFGKTSEGSSLIDYDSEEIRRGISVFRRGGDVIGIRRRAVASHFPVNLRPPPQSVF